MATREETRSGRFRDGRVDGKRLAEDLGVAHGTVKRWLHEGMPCERISHQTRINPAAARAWIAERYPSSIAFDRRAVVYFVQRDSDGAIKIGWTSDLERRLRELRRDARCLVQVLACFIGAKPDELALHARFADERLAEEWFHPSDRLLTFIVSLGRSAA